MQIDLPSWQYIRIKDIQEIKPRNGLYKSASKSRGNVHRWIKMKDLYQNMVIRHGEMETITVTQNEIEAFGCIPGDLLFGRTSLVLDGVGTCSIVGDIKDIPIFESNLFRIRLDKAKAIPLFYLYFFRSPHGRQEVKKIAKHTAAASITGTDLIEIEIPYPSLPEQHNIAGILGALDDKIELNHRMNRTLESVVRAVFRQWFVDREEVESWDTAPLSSICESIFSGGTPSTTKSEYWNGVIPWLSSGETRDKFIIDTEKTITQAGVDNSSTRFARSGSTVIASAGQGKTRGQTSLLMFDTYINQSVVVLNADKKLISDLFLFFGLSGRYDEFRQLSDSHSSRGSLTTKLLGGLQISVPPFEKILEFDKFAKPIVEQINQNLRQSRTLASLRDSLLPKLMRGEVRVKS